ncbi:MAG: capsular biosynthesis protein [Oceanospirillaceae bacterium]|nr:capsular biosynthesis protein [Oceanospirillaceae bacterium]
MIDVHCHLLPAVDDGANNDEESIALFEVAIADGISHMVLTPHIQPGRYENTRKSLLPHFEKLKNLILKQRLDITLSIAGEVRLCAEVLSLYANHELPFIGELNGAAVMLLELPHEGIPPGSDKLIDWLMDRNILPMIAHPERNKAIMRDISKVEPFVDRGCLFQLTAMSITKKFGDQAYIIAHQFLVNDWVSVVASDAHNINRRPPILSEAYETVASQYNNDLAQRLFIDTPTQIISAY